jgi:hypothetical protein
MSDLGENVTITGFYNGIVPNEHTTGGAFIRACKRAVVMESSHLGMNLGMIKTMCCPYLFYFVGTNAANSTTTIGTSSKFKVAFLDSERDKASTGAPISTWMEYVTEVYDPSNYGKGEISYVINEGYTGLDRTIAKTGGTGIRCINVLDGTVT